MIEGLRHMANRDAVCVCCGGYGPVEAHHVAGHRYSEVTTDVCVSCHRILSARQAERRWNLSQATETNRLAMGLLDIVRLVVDRSETPCIAMDVADSLSSVLVGSGVVAVRPQSYTLDTPDAPDDDLHEYDWFSAIAKLLKDVSRTVTDDDAAAHEGAGAVRSELVRTISRMDVVLAYGEMSSARIPRVVRHMLAQLGTAIDPDSQLPPTVREPVFAAMMRGLRDLFSRMTTDGDGTS